MLEAYLSDFLLIFQKQKDKIAEIDKLSIPKAMLGRIQLSEKELLEINEKVDSILKKLNSMSSKKKTNQITKQLIRILNRAIDAQLYHYGLCRMFEIPRVNVEEQKELESLQESIPLKIV